MAIEGFFRKICILALSSPYLTGVSLCVFIVGFTRLWTGYIKSKCEQDVNSHMKKITTLPYWLPFIGHALSFARSPDGLVTTGRDNTKDGVFGLHIAGVQHYMITMPSLARQLYLQRPSVVSSDDFFHWVFDKYFGDGGASKEIQTEDFHTVHKTANSFMKEPFLSRLTDRTFELVQERIFTLISFSSDISKQNMWERVANTTTYGDWVETDLFLLISSYAAEIAGTSLMGKSFAKNNPDFNPDLRVFDSGFNALLTGLPGITGTIRKAKAARSRMSAAVREWNRAVLAASKGKDPGPEWSDLSDVSEVMQLRIQKLQAVNADELFATSQNLAIYWATMVNAKTIIFWMLMNIIASPKLLNDIRSEIQPFAKASDTAGSRELRIDIDGLTKSCPLLKATFFEALRLYTFGTTYKKVLQDVTLTESTEDAIAFGKKTPQSYVVPAGSFLAILHVTLQTDPRLWEDPELFKPERFLVRDEGDDKRVRADMLHLFAFGGGHNVCKGRLFAEREVLMLVASILTVWDFGPVGRKWEIPTKSYNGVGSALPNGKVPVQVRLRKALGG